MEAIMASSAKWIELMLGVMREGEDPHAVTLDEFITRCEGRAQKGTRNVQNLRTFLKTRTALQSVGDFLDALRGIIRNNTRVLESDAKLYGRLSALSMEVSRRFGDTFSILRDPSTEE